MTKRTQDTDRGNPQDFLVEYANKIADRSSMLTVDEARERLRQHSTLDKSISERLASEERQASFWFGVDSERERIVTLLEGKMCGEVNPHHNKKCFCGSFAEAIALIKEGEDD